MQSILIDCGTHLGNGLKELIQIHGLDTFSQIYTFEANPHTHNYLSSLIKNPKKPKSFSFFESNKISRINKAVWINEKGCDFYCSRLDLRELDEKYLKSHLSEFKKGMHIGTHYHKFGPTDGASGIHGNQSKRYLSKFGNVIQRKIKFDEIIRVPSFDLFKFLQGFSTFTTFYICKLDIEGAEYRVLLKFLYKKLKFKRFIFYIEWHDYGLIYRTILRKLITFILKKKGYEIITWK